MDKIWIITRRELASFFDSLIAYVLIVIFLGMSGFFTWLFVDNIFLRGQASLQLFFERGALWTLFVFIPALTMKMLSEETKSGTIELLSTKAVSDWQIVTGKFLACLLLVIIAVSCTIPYYMTVSMLGSVDHGTIIGGYLGIFLLSATYTSIGIFCSALTNNQIVAFLFALIINICLQFIFDLIGLGLTGSIGGLFTFLSTVTHFNSMLRGVVDSRDIIYFFSIILGGLTISQAILSKRNWQS